MNHFIHIKNIDRPNLIFFLHAGALPTQYLSWVSNELKESFNIFVYNKPEAANWDELVEVTRQQISKLPLEKLFIFGHSMGALLAFQSTLDIKDRPINLLLSGMNAPSTKLLERFQQLSELRLEAFTEQLSHFGGIPEDLMKSPEYLMKFAKKTQDDFKLLSTINPSILSLKSHHPHICLFALADKLCQLSEVSNWKHFFSSNNQVKIFQGDHFYLFKYASQVQAYLTGLNKL